MITKSFRMTAVAALLCGVSAMAVAAVTAGTYEGAAQGKLSTVKAAVTLNQDGRITDVKLDVSGETPELGGAAAKKMAPAIVEHQSTAVDGMSGATVSSEAIRKAVAAAIEKAGADPKKYDVKVAKTVGADETLTADIVVVGAGASGTAAAVTAAEAGAKVIVLEKGPAVGGAGKLASGLFAVESSMQKAKYKNNPELLSQLTKDQLYKQLMDYNHYLSSASITRRVIDESSSTVDWMNKHGAKLELIDWNPQQGQNPYPIRWRIYHRYVDNAGAFKNMYDAFGKLGGKLLLQTRAYDLTQDKDGNVTAVIAEKADGGKLTIKTSAVILASGGYGADQSLLPPKMKSFLFYGVDGETGDGLKMGEAIGAATINMDLVKQYPQGVETRPHHGLAATASSTDTMKKSGAIYVNRDGKRFVDENAGLGVLTDKTIEQPGSIAYIVMDEAAWKQYVAKSLEDKLVPSAESLNEWTKIVNNGHPVMAVSKSLEDAAKQMGIDPKGLEATVKHWNDMVKAGSDKDFSRRLTGGLAEGGTWRIVEQKVRYQTTLGGLKADGAMRILKKDGSAIPGLYGAGCVVGGANGADSMTAMMNSWAIVSGVVAAESAASYAK